MNQYGNELVNSFNDFIFYIIKDDVLFKKLINIYYLRVAKFWGANNSLDITIVLIVVFNIQKQTKSCKRNIQ